VTEIHFTCAQSGKPSVLASCLVTLTWTQRFARGGNTRPRRSLSTHCTAHQQNIRLSPVHSLPLAPATSVLASTLAPAAPVHRLQQATGSGYSHVSFSISELNGPTTTPNSQKCLGGPTRMCQLTLASRSRPPRQRVALLPPSSHPSTLSSAGESEATGTLSSGDAAIARSRSPAPLLSHSRSRKLLSPVLPACTGTSLKRDCRGRGAARSLVLGRIMMLRSSL
jgi:hypothetical protein